MTDPFDPFLVQVVNNTDARRFEAKLGDYFALIDYIPSGRNLVITHTEVPRIFEGQGVASKMARVALDYARDNELTVVPLCPFIADFIRKNPEYESLVWQGHGA